MESKIVTTHAALLEITDSLCTLWKNLAKSTNSNCSLFPGWVEITAKSHDIAQGCVVVAAQQNNELVALLPVTLSSSTTAGMRLRALDLVSNYVSYHNQPIASLDPEETIEILVDEANRQDADMIRLVGIPDESSIGVYLQERDLRNAYRLQSMRGEASPYLPLKGTWEQLLASKPKKFRYKTRKRTESLDSSTLNMKWFEDIEDCPALLEAMQIVEQNSWKKQAGVSIFERSNERRYYELLLPYLASRRSMFANVLFHEDSPIAYNLCCSSERWVGQMKTSFDTEFAALSPGSLVIDHAIMQAIERGASEFDFLGGTDPHKLAWSKLVRSHTDYFLYLKSSFKGNIIGALKRLRSH